MSKSKKPKIHAGTVFAAGVGRAEGVATLRVYQPLPVEHPFYHTIGRVASEWAHLEHALDLVIWELLTWKTTGLSKPMIASVTSQIMGVNPRCKVIQSLGSARQLEEKLLKSFRRLASDSFPVSDWRARWVHDPWYAEKGPGTPAQFRAMPSSDPRYGLCDISEDEVQETIDKIQGLRQRVEELFTQVRSAFRASE